MLLNYGQVFYFYRNQKQVLLLLFFFVNKKYHGFAFCLPHMDIATSTFPWLASLVSGTKAFAEEARQFFDQAG